MKTLKEATEEFCSSPDRINCLLASEDLVKLREMHFALFSKGYGLAKNVEHLACYLDKGKCPDSVSIPGSDDKKIVVKPELRLETMLADSGKEIEIDPDHPDYDPCSVGPDQKKQEIDERLYYARNDFIRTSMNKRLKREDILEFELGLRQRDICDHRLFLYQETQRTGNSLYGKLCCYGDEEEGIFLTIASAHWLKEQGAFFYERSAEHYADLGLHFEWRPNMERAVVLETVNGDIKQYPISFNEYLVNEAFPAQVPLAEGLFESGDEGLLGAASMTYRKQEECIRKQGVNSKTGIFVIPSTIKND